MPHPTVRLTGVTLLATLLVLAIPGVASGHAELETATPADGTTVEGTPDVIELLFTEAVSEGSSLELRSSSDAVIATGGPDPAGTTRMTLTPADLAPGGYTVRWTAVADDGHVERGTVAFTVLAPAPTPSPTPAPTGTPAVTPSSSPSASPSPTPTPAPSPSADPTDSTGGTTDVIIPIVAAVVLLGALGAYLLRRRAGGA
jgi:LPXTG-motif cell wall-anchored protein